MGEEKKDEGCWAGFCSCWMAFWGAIGDCLMVSTLEDNNLILLAGHNSGYLVVLRSNLQLLCFHLVSDKREICGLLQLMLKEKLTQ